MSHCTICYERYNEAQRWPLLLVPCGHTFCQNCINGLDQDKRCPTCRTPYRQTAKNFNAVQAAQKTTDYEALFKVFFVGEAAVGKTSLINRFYEGKFESLYIATVGFNFRICDEQYDGKDYRLQLWDSAGSEKYRAITRGSFRSSTTVIVDSDVVVIVYAVNYLASYKEAVGYWVDEARQNLGKEARIMLVGSKCDQKNAVNAVKEEQAREMCEKMGCLHAWVSSMNGTGLAEMWQLLLKTLVEDIKPRNLPQVRPKPLASKSKKTKEEGGCC